MKKFKCFLTLIALFIMPMVVNAASGSIKVSGTSTAVVGNKVTVTVTLSSSTKIGSWQMNLNYDKSYLQLTSSSAEAGGTVMANSTASGVKSKSYTFTFKALKTGSTKVSVSSYLAYAFDDLSELSLSSGSKTIKLITQEQLEASYSKDNNLKSLSIDGYELTPAFSKDILEYNVVVPENTKQVTINAAKNDSKASLDGIGTFDVTQGTNSFEIVVRAENGSEKTYKITVEVKDSNPINVTVNGTNYTVVKIKENLPTINSYQETIIKINSFDVPAYHSDITNITLVGLKDAEGNIKLFIYDAEKNEYSNYNEMLGNKITIYPLNTNKIIKGYKKTKININDIEVDAYVYDNVSDFAVVYGINVETGDEGFYLFDKKDGTFVKYNDEYVNSLNEKVELYTYIIFGFIGLFVILFFICLKLIRKNKKYAKMAKKYSEENHIKIVKKSKVNEIVEVEENDVEENKQNNKKKKK